MEKSGDPARRDELPWSVDARLEVPGATCELRRYHWPSLQEIVEFEPDYVLSLNLGPNAWSGEARYSIAGERAACQAIGKSMLRPANIPMHANISMRANGIGHSGRLLTCTFDKELFECSTGLDDWSATRLRRCANIESPPTVRAMRRMTAELVEPSFGAGMAVEALSRLILVELARDFGLKTDATPARAQLARWQIRRINDYLCSVENSWPSSVELASLCGISASHLSRAFHNTTGITLRQHAEAIRLQRATALLADSQLALKQIAGKLGFATASAFSVAYRRSFGEAPREFRHREKSFDR